MKHQVQSNEQLTASENSSPMFLFTSDALGLPILFSSWNLRWLDGMGSSREDGGLHRRVGL
eukprot:747862-Hanusia_phi.AAC.1